MTRSDNEIQIAGEAGDGPGRPTGTGPLPSGFVHPGTAEGQHLPPAPDDAASDGDEFRRDGPAGGAADDPRLAMPGAVQSPKIGAAPGSLDALPAADTPPGWPPYRGDRERASFKRSVTMRRRVTLPYVRCLDDGEFSFAMRTLDGLFYPAPFGGEDDEFADA